MASLSLTSAMAERIAALAWRDILDSLNTQGFAKVGSLLTAEECDRIKQLYSLDHLFRSRVIMQRHQFGNGEYQYFAYPLPAMIQQLRESVYERLVPLANAWNQAICLEYSFPDTLSEFLATCHQEGQVRPTPLLLKYQAGDFNCLHQDRYGEVAFPLQMAIVLSEPEQDFSGGEFVLVEQKPRAQSRVHVVPLRRGEAVIFAVSHRPVQGTRGVYRVNLKHGVSPLQKGQRYCLGVIFHDAA